MVPDTDALTHPYIGASPGCWSIYADVLGREYGEYAYPECHRLTVDAYAAQHPGTMSRQSIQSVAVHLISLHLIIERNIAPADATRLMPAIVQRASGFTWLQPPATIGTITIIDVAATRDLDHHQRMVRNWAESVWAAWHTHHPIIRTWANFAPRSN